MIYEFVRERMLPFEKNPPFSEVSWIANEPTGDVYVCVGTCVRTHVSSCFSSLFSDSVVWKPTPLCACTDAASKL